ncbi:AAA family ATPase [Acetobacter senegalensis]|uniref:AAA family ATPase n=1 Tax=Acetobacter senegalensis TaxID=446692 RepID=UPI00073E3B3C|nr:AAA family ATPase [Acetobacter senegalensis]
MAALDEALLKMLSSENDSFKNIKIKLKKPEDYIDVRNFIIFSPENSSLRIFEKEGQIEPLGINGEGLFKLLSVLSQDNENETFSEIRKYLSLFGWFEDIKVEIEEKTDNIKIFDSYLCKKTHFFDQRSANEGFLFLLFYFTLFSTNLTPKFFAIDNIDASLNPKLCSELMRKLRDLSNKHNKQAIFTTHNPAILDGLNLNDQSQRLFVVYRGIKGDTKVRRIAQKENIPSETPRKLSELFMRGILGGLPTGF